MIRGALAIALLFVSGHAFADPKAADALAAEASRLDQAGDFHGAALKFAAAAKLDPSRPELFCNIGISFYKAADHPRAHLFLARCLEETSMGDAFIDTARAALAEVDGAIRSSNHAPVRFQVTPVASVRIAELEVDPAFVGNRAIYLAFGTFHVTAHAEGFHDQTVEVVISSKDPKVVTIQLERDTAIGDKPPPPPPASPHRRPSKVPAIVSTLGTLTAIGIAGIAYGKAHSAADTAETALDDQTFGDDKSTVDRWNTTFAVAGSLAVVGTAATAYLWYRAFKTNVEIKPALGGGVAVMFRSRF